MWAKVAEEMQFHGEQRKRCTGSSARRTWRDAQGLPPSPQLRRQLRQRRCSTAASSFALPRSRPLAVSGKPAARHGRHALAHVRPRARASGSPWPSSCRAKPDTPDGRRKKAWHLGGKAFLLDPMGPQIRARWDTAHRGRHRALGLRRSRRGFKGGGCSRVLLSSRLVLVRTALQRIRQGVPSAEPRGQRDREPRSHATQPV